MFGAVQYSLWSIQLVALIGVLHNIPSLSLALAVKMVCKHCANSASYVQVDAIYVQTTLWCTAGIFPQIVLALRSSYLAYPMIGSRFGMFVVGARRHLVAASRAGWHF